MPYIQLPTASLYYETRGSGPLLLCISGADGSVEIWRQLTHHLSQKYTVVSYDRRGYSRSHLTDAQDYSRRLSTDAEDASALITHLSPSKTAIVLGNSAGGVVALKLLAMYPEVCEKVIAYEPPNAALLPDFEELRSGNEEVYATYRAGGPFPALEKFAVTIEEPKELGRSLGDARGGVHVASNIQYWFERELLVYTKILWDVEKDFGGVKEKLILVVGELSKKTPYQVRANFALAEKLGLEVLLVPGSHVGHATHAEAFGKRVVEILEGR